MPRIGRYSYEAAELPRGRGAGELVVIDDTAGALALGSAASGEPAHPGAPGPRDGRTGLADNAERAGSPARCDRCPPGRPARRARLVPCGCRDRSTGSTRSPVYRRLRASDVVLLGERVRHMSLAMTRCSAPGSSGRRVHARTEIAGCSPPANRGAAATAGTGLAARRAARRPRPHSRRARRRLRRHGRRHRHGYLLEQPATRYRMPRPRSTSRADPASSPRGSPGRARAAGDGHRPVGGGRGIPLADAEVNGLADRIRVTQADGLEFCPTRASRSSC